MTSRRITRSQTGTQLKMISLCGNTGWRINGDFPRNSPEFVGMFELLSYVPAVSFGSFDLKVVITIRNPTALPIQSLKSIAAWKKLCRRAEKAIKEHPTHGDWDYGIELHGDKDAKTCLCSITRNGIEIDPKN